MIYSINMHTFVYQFDHYERILWSFLQTPILPRGTFFSGTKQFPRESCPGKKLSREKLPLKQKFVPRRNLYKKCSKKSCPRNKLSQKNCPGSDCPSIHPFNMQSVSSNCWLMFHFHFTRKSLVYTSLMTWIYIEIYLKICIKTVRFL